MWLGFTLRAQTDERRRAWGFGAVSLLGSLWEEQDGLGGGGFSPLRGEEFGVDGRQGVLSCADCQLSGFEGFFRSNPGLDFGPLSHLCGLPLRGIRERLKRLYEAAGCAEGHTAAAGEDVGDVGLAHANYLGESRLSAVASGDHAESQASRPFEAISDQSIHYRPILQNLLRIRLESCRIFMGRAGLA